MIEAFVLIIASVVQLQICMFLQCADGEFHQICPWAALCCACALRVKWFLHPYSGKLNDLSNNPNVPGTQNHRQLHILKNSQHCCCDAAYIRKCFVFVYVPHEYKCYVSIHNTTVCTKHTLSISRLFTSGSSCSCTCADAEIHESRAPSPSAHIYDNAWGASTNVVCESERGMLGINQGKTHIYTHVRLLNVLSSYGVANTY